MCCQRGEIELAAAAPGTLDLIRSAAEEQLPAGEICLIKGKLIQNNYVQ